MGAIKTSIDRSKNIYHRKLTPFARMQHNCLTKIQNICALHQCTIHNELYLFTRACQRHVHELTTAHTNIHTRIRTHQLFGPHEVCTKRNSLILRSQTNKQTNKQTQQTQQTQQTPQRASQRAKRGETQRHNRAARERERATPKEERRAERAKTTERESPRKHARACAAGRLKTTGHHPLLQCHLHRHRKTKLN